MVTKYFADEYKAAFLAEASNENTVGGKVVVLTTPTIKIIPAEQVFDNIFCSTATCHIGLEETETISTTRSNELGFSAGVSGSAFGTSMSFIASYSYYSFSETVESSTAFTYQFDLV